MYVTLHHEINAMEQLFKTLNQRKRPEDVAQMILDFLGEELTLKESKSIEKAAKNSLKRNYWGYSSMAQTFATAHNAKKQIAKTTELFNVQYGKNPEDTEALSRFIEEVSALIGKTAGENDFVKNRKNKQQRKEHNIDLSKRAYNKRWRLLKRLEEKLHKYIRESKKIEFQKISKHGIVHHLSFEEFAKDRNTACFIAYYTARCNMRSEFTIYGQQSAFDEISNVLFNKCRDSVTTNWWAMAYVYPAVKVLSLLPDNKKGELLGMWTGILQQIAELLEDLWHTNDIARETMVVKRGNDSTTWNNTAGAWNKARDNWMSLIYAMGMTDILDNICFGKVLRLMAADVVAWHYRAGSKLDPNTQVWNKLPLPWEVFEGKAQCNKAIIEQVCKEAGVDALKSGWIAPREHKVVPYKPTPELVHGVSVFNPFLASELKKIGYFSGK